MSPILIYGVGLVRAMNMAQLPLSDTELQIYAEALWNTPRTRTFDIEGLICSPAHLTFLDQVHATVNNELVNVQMKTPYGYNDSAASSHTSACFEPSVFTEEMSLVRVIMYEIYNPFDVTIYEWAIKGTTPALDPLQIDPPLAVNPLHVPMTTNQEINVRRNQLWRHPIPESAVFEGPWFVEESNTNPELLCVRTHVGHYPWVDVWVDDYQLRKVVRDTTTNNGETLCFTTYRRWDMLIQVTIQSSPTEFLTHQWAVKIGLTTENKPCLSISNSLSNCF
jgi:hypothetical protein